MSDYVHKNLISGESVVYSGKLSLWSLTGLILLGIILLPLYGAGLLCFLAAYIKMNSTELAVTNKRVIAKTGFISRSTIEMNLNKVESIHVEQGILGRILNYGSIRIHGTGASNTPIPGITDPLSFRKSFMEAQDQYAK